MAIRFLSIGSGSCGNCYFIGTHDYGFLIDAGVPVREVKNALKEANIAFEQIRGIVVTHDHTDHIKYVGCLANMGIPVYATERVHNGMSHCHGIVEQVLPISRRLIEKEHTFCIGDFSITPFSVPHDGTDNAGYCIEAFGLTFVLATDVGFITDTIASYLVKANYLVIEANYDEEMLRMGAYPNFLKRRIAGKYGHLSNIETANFLSEHYSEKLRHVWLCHLSKDNNHPELAYKTVEMKMMDAGIAIGKDMELTTLKRSVPSEIYELT